MKDTEATIEVVSSFIRIGNRIINTDHVRNAKIEPGRFELYYSNGERETFKDEEAELLTAYFDLFTVPVEPPPEPVTLAIETGEDVAEETAPEATVESDAAPSETEEATEETTTKKRTTKKSKAA